MVTQEKRDRVLAIATQINEIDIERKKLITEMHTVVTSEEFKELDEETKKETKGYGACMVCSCPSFQRGSEPIIYFFCQRCYHAAEKHRG
jgi:hypothetical protein